MNYLSLCKTKYIFKILRYKMDQFEISFERLMKFHDNSNLSKCHKIELRERLYKLKDFYYSTMNSEETDSNIKRC